MRLSEAQNLIDQYISQFKAGYFPPLANLARLMEEVGELAREINHHHGPKTKRKEENSNPELLEMELADVLFTVLVLANQLNIDMEVALQKTLDKVSSRDGQRWERKDNQSA